MKKILKKIIISLFALVLCFSAVSCGNKNDQVPTGFKRASNKNADYSLFVPDSWIVDTSTGVTVAKVSETDASNISFMGFELDGSVLDKDDGEGDSEEKSTLDRFWEYYSAEFTKTFPDMKYDEDGNGVNMLVSKLAAKKYIYTATVTGIEYKFMQIVVIKGETVYLLTYTAQKETFAKHLDKVLDIAKYLEIK